MTHVTLNDREARALARDGRVLWARPCKEQPHAGVRYSPGGARLEDGHGRELRCPLTPGTVVWGRESFSYISLAENEYDPNDSRQRRHPLGFPASMLYRADALAGGWENNCPWSKPVSMPRWASRFPSLRVGVVRCVRVMELGEADAAAAGFTGQEEITFDEIGTPGDKFTEWWHVAYPKLSWATAYAWVVELSVESEGE